MRKVALLLVAVGAAATLGWWLGRRQPAGAGSGEPRYAGRTFSDWMEHWYVRAEGGHFVEDTNTAAALRQMGTNALPGLLQWLDARPHSLFDVDYPARALKGFRVLGPVAGPAVPELIRRLDQTGSCPAQALAYIGPVAVPALTACLAAADPVPAPSNPASGRSVSPGSALARSNAIHALCLMGTNAEAAMPVLIDCLNAGDESVRGAAAGALATIGQHRPERVIPALENALTNATGSTRAEAADALAVFGSEAGSAAPLLRLAGGDPDPYLRSHAAAALRQIAPGTPDVLAPLIQNLCHPDGQVREQALGALETLGTNGAEALPALVECLQDPVPAARVMALRCVRAIDQSPEDIVVGVSENLSHTNRSVVAEAVRTLGSLARHSSPAFLALLRVMNRSEGVGRRARFALGDAARSDAAGLLDSLEHPDPVIRNRALLVLVDLGQAVPGAVPKLVHLLEDQDARVRRSAAYALWVEDQETARSLGIKSPW